MGPKLVPLPSPEDFEYVNPENFSTAEGARGFIVVNTFLTLVDDICAEGNPPQPLPPSGIVPIDLNTN